MRRALLLITALALAAPAASAASYGDTVLATPGLVAYFPFDEPSGSGFVVDAVEPMNAPMAGVHGAPPGIDNGGFAVRLNTYSSAGAVFGNILSTRLAGDRTVEAWAQEAVGIPNVGTIVTKGGTSTGYHLYMAGGVPTFRVNRTRATGVALAQGTWHHLVGTLADRTMTLYVDGRQVGTATAAGSLAATDDYFVLGQGWSGSLDDISIYNRALTADEVMDHFAAGVDRAPPVTHFVTTPPAVVSSASAHFTFAASKTGIAFACRLDGGAWTPCVDGATYWGLKDGAHTVEVRGTDRWGTVEAAPPAFHWTVDITPPRSFLLVLQPTALRPGSAAIGSEAGSTFQCRSVNGAWATCPSTFALPDLGHSYGVYVRAIDAAGNVETGESSVVVQPRPASASFVGAPAIFTPSKPFGRRSWSCSVDGGPTSLCPRTFTASSDQIFTFSRLGYGTHRLRVSDAAIPGIAWPTLTWTDPLPPPLLAGAQFPALVMRGAHRIPRLLVQSNAPGKARLALQRGGRTIARWTAPVRAGSNALGLSRRAWRALRGGRYVLSVQATSGVGTSAPLTVRFDVVHALRR